MLVVCRRRRGDCVDIFGSYLTKLKPVFDPRNVGYKKLSDLMRARADLFVVDEREMAGSKVLYVRAK